MEKTPQRNKMLLSYTLESNRNVSAKIKKNRLKGGENLSVEQKIISQK